ncbi:uncharacterized protein N0V89_006860 [Didymosphaeria variabile]|uniref:Mid2 domain-containing protein n=1 Tax=Didymosphaeria variabile TaxID=1932322 RepID=A0A9W8XIG0_9PLEO|nr:uncharacterized protein N0V89_006860 [Didymosphaeria variabile]KAJ4351517.1 hypothetical protein N0V89_006860 [Didymosphaeria variabile]
MPSIHSFRLVLIFSLLLQLVFAEQKCYALNGTQLGDAYGPCNPDAKHSGCCAIHHSAGSVELCLSNGLCMATKNEYMGTIWQTGCTDPTGKDPSCPKMCPDTPQIKTKFVGAFQFETSTSTESSTSSPASTTSSRPSSTSASPTTSQIGVVAAATSSVSSLPTASNESSTCAADKHQLKVVGGTLAAFFCAAIAGLLAATFFLFKKEKKQRKLKEHYEAQFATTSWGAYGASKSTVVGMASTRDSLDKDVEVRYIGRQIT